MKKIDISMVLHVILALILFNVAGRGINDFVGGIASLLNKSETLTSVFELIEGILLIGLVTIYAFRFTKLKDKFDLPSMIINLSVALLVFIFAIVLAAKQFYYTAATYIYVFATILALSAFMDIPYLKTFKVVKGPEEVAPEAKPEPENVTPETEAEPEESTPEEEPKEPQE